VAANVTVDWPLDTVVDAGTVRLALLLAIETAVLAVAALDSVTVQVEAAAEVSVEGEQTNEVSVAR